MKRLLLIAFTSLSIHAIAQTNTFPSSGNVGIGTTTPQQTLTIDTRQSSSNAGVPGVNGETQNGILRLQVDGNSWGEVMDFGMNVLPSYAWIQATNRGNLGLNYNLVLNPNGGNVGIGTTTINNVQGWNRVVDEYASGHAKLLVRTDNVVTGIFSHDTWNGAVGRIGTESPHDLRLMAGYGHEVMSLTISGNVGIGTTNPAYKLDVLGTIRAKEVLVNLDGGADFVFEKGYKLLPIEHVANYVQENKHLPDIPSANEMVKNGVSMGDMQVKLLQKVEELTLYAIQQDQSKKELEAKLSKQENQYNALLEKVEMLTKQIEKK